MIKQTLAFACGIMIAFSCDAAKLEGPFAHFVVFGDSLSDMGNNTWVISDGGQKGTPIVNIDQATGKRQNWVQFLNDKAFPGQTLYTYAQAETLKNPVDANIDMAFASAETGMNYLNDLSPAAYPPYDTFQCTKPGFISPIQSCVPGVEKQISIYLYLVDGKISPQTLFIIWGGGNDIFNNVQKLLTFYGKNQDKFLLAKGFFTLFTGGFSNEGLNLSHPIGNLQSAYETLIAAGASPSQILVLNLPDIAISPAAKQLANGDQKFLHFFTLMSLNFNMRLKVALWNTNVFSIYDLFNQIVTDPQKYGLTNVTQSCLAQKQGPFCTGYAFYNSKHGTSALDRILADKLFATIGS